VSQFFFGCVLLFDISENLLYLVFKHPIASKHLLGRFLSQHINLSIAVFVYHEILDISLDLIKNYSLEVTNRINYFGCFYPEQILVEENINIHRYKEGIKLASVSIIKI
jgi:hypothetical protein